jgi:predicted CXXCH cytochrome family protein
MNPADRGTHRAPPILIRACALAAVAVAAIWTAQPASGQTIPDGGCGLCHAELELLRQHAPNLAEARRLVTRRADIDASAHQGMACAECHTGFGRYPHTAGPTAVTATCQSCHEEQTDPWTAGVHGVLGDDREPAAGCSACHGVHTVASAQDLVADHEEGQALSVQCVSCHEARALPAMDPHADSTRCADCHAPHRTRAVDDPESWVAPALQGETCGACHEENAEAWRVDVHGAAVLGHPLPRPGEDHADDPATSHEDDPAAGEDRGGGHAKQPVDAGAEPATCTACHGGHGVHPVEEDRLAGNSSAICEGCHSDYAGSYLDSYHGQATSLGSRAAADCAACHGSHEIYPSRDHRSWVGDERLLETCQTCHPRANASFAAFAPHVDHHDRENYPYVYWSYRLMTGLLIGVFAVFGLHTFLWLGRLTLFRGADDGHGDGSGS